MSRTRIFYVGSPALFSKGASSIHMMKMCQAMTRMGIDVELIFPSHSSNEDIFDYYGITDKFRITTIPFTNLFARQIVHGAASAFHCRSRRSEYDLVVTRNIIFTYIATTFLGIPTVYDAHHPPVNSIARGMFRSFKDSKYLLRFSTNSMGLGDIYLDEGLSREKLVVAHNGVEIERFDNDMTVPELRDRLSLEKDKKIVCYCGNTYEGRGIEMMVEAASRFRDVVFLVVGGLDEDNVRYEALAREMKADNFIIRGFVPHTEVAEYLMASDVLVIPYSSQMTIKGGTRAVEFTSPIKLFEYMAAGKPILASSLPTISEIVEDNITATFFEPGNITSFCEKLDVVLNNRNYSKTLSENASSKVLEYTWEARAEKILRDICKL